MLTPAQISFRKIHQASDAQLARHADSSQREQVLEVAHSWNETIGKGRHMKDSGTLRCLVQLHCLAIIHAQLLFNKHMLASSNGGKRNRGVQNGRGSDNSRIDAAMLQQVVIVREGVRDAVFLGALAHQIGVTISQSDDFCIGAELQPWKMHVTTDTPKANHANADSRFVQLIFLSLFFGSCWLHITFSVLQTPLLILSSFYPLYCGKESSTVRSLAHLAPISSRLTLLPNFL